METVLSRDEILSHIHKLKTSVANATSLIEKYESLLIGDEHTFRTPKGFLAYLDRICKMVRWFHESDYFKDFEKGWFTEKSVVLIKYGKKDYLAFKIDKYSDDSEHMSCVVHRVLKFEDDVVSPNANKRAVHETEPVRHTTSRYRKISTQDILLQTYSGKVTVFKDGKWLNFFKEKVLDHIIEVVINKKEAEELKAIQEQQEKFKSIDF